jgi:hypothetical protein
MPKVRIVTHVLTDEESAIVENALSMRARELARTADRLYEDEQPQAGLHYMALRDNVLTTLRVVASQRQAAARKAGV